MTSIAGSSPQPETSSTQVKANSPIAAGQRPHRSGYGRFSCGQQRAQRAERRERAVDPAEQDRGEHQPDPERDQQERRRPVVQRGPAAEIAGQDRDDQQQDPDRAPQDLQRQRGEPAPARQRAPVVALQPRLRPQHGQREERDHQHGGRRPGEQPLRDRELLALDEAVRLARLRHQHGGGQRRREAPRARASQAGLDGVLERGDADRALEPGRDRAAWNRPRTATARSAG